MEGIVVDLFLIVLAGAFVCFPTVGLQHSCRFVAGRRWKGHELTNF